MQELFIDGPLNIGFGRGVVRLDLGSLDVAPPKSEAEKLNPTLEPRLRLVMTVEGMFALMNSLQQMADHLAKTGVVKLERPQPKEPEAAAKAVDQSAPQSPNFS